MADEQNQNPEPDAPANGDTPDNERDTSAAAVGLGASLDAQEAAAEADERAAQVKYSAATYTVPEDGQTFEDVAEAVGLPKQFLAELVAINQDFPFGLRSSLKEGDKGNLPRGYSYVDVEHVDGGEVVENDDKPAEESGEQKSE